MEADPHFWSPDHFDLEDELNRRIWDESPKVQRGIQAQQDVLSAGAIGAQQAMVCERTLPWVPDLVGKDSRAEDGVLIVGSAYAGFISEHSTRARTMPLDVYEKCQTSSDFQRQFLECVIRRDHAYYGKIQRRAQKKWKPAQITLFDLCRVSFVRRSAVPHEPHKSGDGIACARPDVFTRYVESVQPASWTWERILSSQAVEIIALGRIAEHGLLRLFASKGMRIQNDAGAEFVLLKSRGGSWVSEYADSRFKLGYWEKRRSGWHIEGGSRTWKLSPRYHPSARAQGQHAFASPHVVQI